MRVRLRSLTVQTASRGLHKQLLSLDVHPARCSLVTFHRYKLSQEYNLLLLRVVNELTSQYGGDGISR